MKRLLKNEGFTLIEVIMSIAILSIVSAVVLQLFITSMGLNNKSRTIDVAGVYAANAIENLKALTLDEARVIKQDHEWLYDSDWQLINNNKSAQFKLVVKLRENIDVAENFYEIQSKNDRSKNKTKLSRIHYWALLF